MSGEIDRLEIQVEASANRANKQLDTLIAKLSSVSKSLSGINSSGLVGFSSGINKLTESMRGMKDVRTSDFTRLAKNIQKISSINSAGLNSTASSLSNISRAFNNIGAASKNSQSVSVLAVNLGKLGGMNVQKAIASMPQLASSMKMLMATLSQAPNVSKNVIQMTNALANLAAQGTKARTAANAIKSVGDSSNSSAGKTNILTSAFLLLQSRTQATNSTFKTLLTTLLKVEFGLGSVGIKSRSLSSSFSAIYANCFILIRGFRLLGKSVEKSMDYIETYNYYNVVIDKIGKEFSNSFAENGYASAEAYAESFKSRLNDLTTKMSGFDIGDDGTLSFANNKNLSLDPELLMNYQASIAAVTNSVGLIGETSVNASKALSMLAADMSSLKNVDLKTVMTNFQSGLIGQSRALYKYGIDITNATLQTYAYKHGISMAVSEMTQSDKMQLRLLAILDQSKIAWGDQANTINSVANQYRIFKQQISNLARIIGNLFIPVLQLILPVVNGVLIAFQKLVVFIGSLFGIDYSKIMDGISGGYSGFDDALGDIGEDTDDVVDSTDGIGNSLDNANTQAKKLQRTLLGFDEINKLNDVSDDSSNGSGGGSGITPGNGSGGGINLADDIAKALAEYEKIWNDAFAKSVNKAQEYADKISSIFSKMWKMLKSGDYEGLGKYIAGGVDYVFEKINSVFNWDKMGPGITKFVDAYCRTINSLVENIDWNNIGKTIGDGLNVITNTLYLYLTGIDWVNIGRSLADGLNGMIHSIDWDMLGRTIGAWLMKIPKIIYGFVTTLDWSGLGTGIGNALNGVLKEFDGKMIADGINGIINGILTALKSFIKTVDWSEVAKAVGDVLGNLDWGALAKVGLAIGAVKLVKGLGTLLKAASFEAITKILGDKIVGAISKISLAAAADGLKRKIGSIFTMGIFTGIGTKMASALSGIGPSIAAALSGIGTAITGALAAAAGALGISVGALVAIVVAAVAAIVAVVLNWDEIKEFFTTTLPNWWNETVVPWVKGLPEFFKELPGKIYEKIVGVKDRFVEWASGIVETVRTEVPKIIDNIVNFFAEIPEKIGYAIGFVAGKLAAWGASIGEWIAENIPLMIENIVTFFVELPGKIWDAIILAKDKFVEWAEQIWSFLSTKIPEIIGNVVDFFIELPGKIWNAIVSAVSKLGQWCSDLYQKVSEEVPKIVNKAIEFFAELPNKLLDIGKNLVKGFIDGIKSMWQTVKKEVGDFVSGIIKGFTDGFDVHSPSRILYGIGENVVKGFGNAINDKWGGVQKNLSSLIEKTTSKIDRALSGIKEKSSNTVRSLSNAFSNIKLPHINISWNKVSFGKTSISVPSFGLSFYASGGFPGMGEMFVARENGPEMVGRIGNRSTVANNDQITDGIAAAVEPAVYNGVSAALSSSNSGGGAPQFNIYVGGRKITDVVVEEINNITKSTGECPILT